MARKSLSGKLGDLEATGEALVATPAGERENMTREDLIRKLHDLEVEFTKRLFDLQQHQAELAAQQAELVESQRQLEESRDRYADLYGFAPVGFVNLDRNGVIREINLTAARLLDTERAKLIGTPLVTFVAKDHRRTFLDHLVRCRKDHAETVLRVDIALHTHAGRHVPVELQSHRVGGLDGRSINSALIDLTDRQRAEQERSRAKSERERIAHAEQVMREAGEAKDRFLAMLSHELRAPLASISFALGAIREHGGLPPAVGSSLQMIARSIGIEARLIDELLDVTRIQRGKLHVELEVVDAHAVLDDVVRMSSGEARTRGIELELDLAAPAHHVRADPVRLRQVFWNLVDNAFKHTPRGGRVSLGSVEGRAGEVCLFVRDTGEGVPENMTERLFEPFEQGGAPRGGSGGLGLGLAICRGIIEAHHGRIAASRPENGPGSVFTVVLPTVAAPAVTSSQPAASQRGPSAARRILLVEDNPDNAAAVSEYLGVRGYDVRLADSMQAALRVATEGFDVLVSDIGLPDGSGVDLLRKLREERSVAAVALSGYGTKSDVARSRDAGFQRHLTKPVDPEELIDAIERVAATEPPGRTG
jgi:PAS domain S-box-containing protein